MKVSNAGKSWQVGRYPSAPRDLKRDTAAFTSLAGVPLEVVRNIIHRHSNSSATQKYLGWISGTEALK